VEFKEKFIAFLDILGWKALIAKAEAGVNGPDPLKLLDCFGTGQERARFEQHGPTCCPLAHSVSRNLDFRLTRASDSAVVSAEISPAGVINLLWHCWGSVMRLLEHGVLCRGYVTRGRIHHTEEHFAGSGYQRAYEAEREVDVFRREADERGTPFVELDESVTRFVEDCSDLCVKELFSRMTRREGADVALFPFKRLEQHFLVAAPGYTFNAARQRLSNQNLRARIQRYKETVQSQVDPSNPNAVRKVAHYLAALDHQLTVCDDTDRTIDMFDLQRKRGI